MDKNNSALGQYAAAVQLFTFRPSTIFQASKLKRSTFVLAICVFRILLISYILWKQQPFLDNSSAWRWATRTCPQLTPIWTSLSTYTMILGNLEPRSLNQYLATPCIKTKYHYIIELQPADHQLLHTTPIPLQQQLRQILITVRETNPENCFQSFSTNWLIDRNQDLLFKTSSTPLMNLMKRALG